MPCRGKISLIRVVRPFSVLNIIDQLGDKSVEIHVALPVGMTGQIDRHTIYKGRKIRAVIEIEPTQEILIGLAITAMLGSDHAGNKFNELTDARKWTILDLLLAYESLRCGLGVSNEVGAAFFSQHRDFLQFNDGVALRFYPICSQTA